METILSSDVIVAYSICARKAFLLLFTTDKGKSVEYIDILKQKATSQKRICETREKFSDKGVQIRSLDDLKQKGNLLFDVTLEFQNFQASCDILRKTSNGDYEPSIFIGTHGINKQDKLRLTYVAHVLKEMSISCAQNGVIINVNDNKNKISLKNDTKYFRKIILFLQDWQRNPPETCPQIFLNKNCSYCQFLNLCREKAKHDDNLSLLSGISARAIQTYAKKGIFTVNQLSYFFKPRRLKKQAKSHHRAHKPELQALAIRNNKIYIQELPKISRSNTELFIDFEGIPDQSFYYLFGLLVKDGINCKNKYYCFWAANVQQEGVAWQQFIEKIQDFPMAPIYHYGNYELKALTTLSKRYDLDSDFVDSIKKRFINVNAYIFGKVYFPSYSNSLKDIGRLIGAKWEPPNSTGLQSLVWRHYWDTTSDLKYKDTLVGYNNSDCFALELLLDKLTTIKISADILSEVDFVSKPKKIATAIGEQIHSQFESILEFAHDNYDKKKIRFHPSVGEKAKGEQKRGCKLGYQGQRKTRLEPDKTIESPAVQICPNDGIQLKTTNLKSKRVIVDLQIIDNSLRKTITEFVGYKGYCPKCKKLYLPREIEQYGRNQVYGYGYRAWIIYQRVALRMSYGNIADALLEQFSEKEPGPSIAKFIISASNYYEDTEQIITQKLLASSIIHADETPVNIRGVTQYVWTFVNENYVIYKLSKTREATIAHEFLSTFSGILISDFYAGYDSIRCRQQKCWVHLIRDLNDDLWACPFDSELEGIVSEVRGLIVPIMESIQIYGLKKEHLSPFLARVDEFYNTCIVDNIYKSELATKYQNRFAKYRDNLFLFLKYDDVPWHNNTAERALRQVILQQQISLIFHEKVTPDYLRLLSIRETLKFQEKSFYKFLFSMGKDIDDCDKNISLSPN